MEPHTPRTTNINTNTSTATIVARLPLLPLLLLLLLLLPLPLLLLLLEAMCHSARAGCSLDVGRSTASSHRLPRTSGWWCTKQRLSVHITRVQRTSTPPLPVLASLPSLPSLTWPLLLVVWMRCGVKGKRVRRCGPLCHKQIAADSAVAFIRAVERAGTRVTLGCNERRDCVAVFCSRTQSANGTRVHATTTTTTTTTTTAAAAAAAAAATPAKAGSTR